MDKKTNDVIICVKKDADSHKDIFLWLKKNYENDFIVKLVSSTQEAMSVMGQVSMLGYHPAVFMCDATYDNISGDELVKIILQLFPHVITVMLADEKENDIVLKTLNESGLFGYIKTPCEEEQVVQVVNRAIGEYHYHMDARRQAKELEVKVRERTEKINHIMNDFKQAQEIAHVGNWSWDIRKNVIEWSDEAYSLLGVSPINFSSSFESFINLLHKDDKKSVQEAINRALIEDVEYDTYSRIIKSDKQEYILHHKGTVKRDSNAKAISMLGTIHDVTKLKLFEKQLSSYKEMIDKYVIVSMTDLAGIITDVSDAFCEVSGYSRYELIGKNHNIQRHPDMKDELFADLWSTIKSGKTWEGEIKNLKKDGTPYWAHAHISPLFENSKIKGYIAIRTDITDKKRIEEISILDELTNLYNRRYFNQIFDKELKRAKRENKIFVFVMMDVDNFKKYNDTYGHSSGDDVLQKIANVLRTTLMRSGDTAFRLGGEEFGVIMSVTKEEDAKIVTDKMKDAIFELNIEHLGNENFGVVTASFGIKIVREPYAEMQDIYKEADNALYGAKRAGRNIVIVS